LANQGCGSSQMQLWRAAAASKQSLSKSTVGSLILDYLIVCYHEEDIFLNAMYDNN
jgi:hypothetical protein